MLFRRTDTAGQTQPIIKVIVDGNSVWNYRSILHLNYQWNAFKVIDAFFKKRGIPCEIVLHNELFTNEVLTANDLELKKHLDMDEKIVYLKSDLKSVKNSDSWSVLNRALNTCPIGSLIITNDKFTRQYAQAKRIKNAILVEIIEENCMFFEFNISPDKYGIFIMWCATFLKNIFLKCNLPQCQRWIFRWISRFTCSKADQRTDSKRVWKIIQK